ncbi:hypothetical protein [Marinomonas sp. 2405UD68-3]|uniref:hypothetical protein n=1 Tax=Marinomonas sp. 2405UD68-3 TaxID=3391835 RepID=UPI0039C9F20A
MINKILIPTILIFASTHSISNESWSNLNDRDLKASLQSSINTLKAQSVQIHTNKAKNQQQTIDITNNLNLINRLRADTNNKFVAFRGNINNQFGSLKSEVKSQFGDVGSQLKTVDGNLANHYGIIRNLNAQAIEINGFDSISSKKRSGTTMMENVASLQTAMSDNGKKIKNNKVRLDSLDSQIESKASLSDVKNNIKLNIKHTSTCTQYTAFRNNESNRAYRGTKRPSSSHYNDIKCIREAVKVQGYLY